MVIYFGGLLMGGQGDLIPSKTLLYTVDISGMELIMPPGEKPNIVSFKHYPYMLGFLMCSAIRWPTHASTFRCTKCINLLVDGPVPTPEGAHGMNGLPSIMVDSLYCVWKSRERENNSTLSCVSFSFRYFRQACQIGPKGVLPGKVRLSCSKLGG